MSELLVIGFSCLLKGFWDFQGANPACFFGATKASCCAKNGQGSDPFQVDEDYCQVEEALLLLCTFFGREIGNCQHTENAGVVCHNQIGRKQKPDMHETKSFMPQVILWYCNARPFFQHAHIDIEAAICFWGKVVSGCDHTSVGYSQETKIIVKKSNYLSTCKYSLQDFCIQVLFLQMSQLPLNDAAWIVLK